MTRFSLCLLGLSLLLSTGVGDQHAAPPGRVGSIPAGGKSAVEKHGKLVVCYVASWAGYRPGRGAFNIEELEAGLNGCSHLVYAFAGLNGTTSAIRSLDPFRDLSENYGKGNYRRMTSLRRRYPHLKITLAIGGWNEGSANYSAMASSPQTRNHFVASAIDFVSNYDFDGLDLDWEYPGARGGRPEDKKNFVALVRELREAFNSRGWILTAAFGAGKATVDGGYDVRSLAPHMDLFHLMCYDYHGAWDHRTGHNAPLHKSLQATEKDDSYFTVEYSVKYFLELGAPARKIVMGVPMYGRTFLLKDMNEEKDAVIPGMPSKDKGFQGPITKEDGFMGYNEICLELKNERQDNEAAESGWKIGWDEASKTPYASMGERWFSYDDERSLKEKVKFAMENELAGIMVWSIDTDDFHGDCSDGKNKFPLLNSINSAIVEALEEQENIIPDDKKDEMETASGSISVLSMSIHFLSVISLLVLNLGN